MTLANALCRFRELAQLTTSSSDYVHPCIP